MPAPGLSAVPPRTGFVDATNDLLHACSQLQLGQMVTVPGFTLMDSMSAIQIMDARMDSGMELPISEIPETDRIPDSQARLDYDVFQPLDGHDVIWIMDRLTACEASWHLGRALSQTIYTCLYFHDLKKLSPRALEFLSRPSTSKPAPPPELVCLVLRAFIVATVKTCDIVWNELTKQNVYDGEDFSSDKSGLSLLEGTDPRFALAQLDEAVAWLSAESAMEESIVHSLKARLFLRKQILSATMLLAERDPASWMEVSLHCRFAKKHLDVLRPHLGALPSAEGHGEVDAPVPLAPIGLQDPSRQKAPSPRSMASFDPAYNRKLVATAPLRPVALPSADETWSFLDQLLQALQETVNLMQRPSVLSWKMFFGCKAYEFQGRQTSPYIRSLYQSSVCDRNMVANRLPLDWLSETFFAEVALVDPLLLRRVSRIGRSTVEGGVQTAWNAPPSLGQSVSFFTQRIAGNVVNFLTTLSQNRSRQKRSLAKTYLQWTNLVEEASELGKRLESLLRPEDYMPDSLFASLQHFALDVALHVILSGFELELYRCDEWAGIYFVASKICREQALVCTEIRDALVKRLSTTTAPRPRRADETLGYLASQAEMARALEAASVGSIMLLATVEPTLEPRSWPLLTSNGAGLLQGERDGTDHTAALARATFASRIKWLEIPNVRQSRQSIDNLWNEYSVFRTQVCSLGPTHLLAEAEANFDRAATELESHLARRARETQTELCQAQHREVSGWLRQLSQPLRAIRRWLISEVSRATLGWLGVAGRWSRRCYAPAARTLGVSWRAGAQTRCRIGTKRRLVCIDGSPRCFRGSVRLDS
ncbi:N-alpha-acetyltransferase, non-catalitic subunit [Thecaphora frezii]